MLFLPSRLFFWQPQNAFTSNAKFSTSVFPVSSFREICFKNWTLILLLLWRLSPKPLSWYSFILCKTKKSFPNSSSSFPSLHLTLLTPPCFQESDNPRLLSSPWNQLPSEKNIGLLPQPKTVWGWNSNKPTLLTLVCQPHHLPALQTLLQGVHVSRPLCNPNPLLRADLQIFLPSFKAHTEVLCF